MKERKFTWAAIKRDMRQHWALYLMAIPLIAFFIVFAYMPMGGLLMAFENYKPNKGFLGSDFVGLKNFMDFFGSPFAFRTIRNTLVISFLQLIIEFPLVIVFALLINEIKMGPFRKAVQTLTYMPYFISMVVMAGIIVDFVKSTGVVGQLVGVFTGTPTNLLGDPKYWRPLYIATNLWQGLGFSSIIYVAALSGIDQELYEAAEIDGATRWKQTLHITLPGIASTIIIMLILRVGSIMAVGQEKTILLYNSQVYETADIISSFIYRKGLLEFNYGYSTAVSLFNSVINFILLVTTNQISKKFSETSLF
ncbi:MAG: sugar ABC transporter permease [Acutalibacter sp.]|nr:sugar ABC transporter permease [Acutalibacter sp.]